MNESVLVIDDVDAALQLMTEIGRAVARAAALEVRDAVLHYAIGRGWSVVPYQAFAAWAKRLVESNDNAWIVLDPLFAHSGRTMANVFPLRLTRIEQFQGFEYGEGWDKLPEGEIGLLDDAAASGFTLRHVSRWIEQSGRTVRRYVVCGSNRVARDAVTRGRPNAVWSQLFSGDCTPIHLRDGCAHLPFSGRRVNLSPIAGAGGVRVELRSPAAAVLGSPWHSLNVIGPIRSAVEQGRRTVANAFSAELGRPAVVADLPLLGAAIPAWVEPGQSPEAATRLMDIVEPRPARPLG